MGLLLSCAPKEEEPTPPPPSPGQQEEEEEEEPPPPPPPPGVITLTPNPVTPLNPVFGGIITYGASAAFGSFDTHVRTYGTISLVLPIFNNLVQYNPDYKETFVENVIGDLAYDWDISADAKTYTFYLTQGVKWHDGEDFDADDVVYSVEKWMDPKQGGRLAVYFPAHESIEKVDQYTVKIHLKHPSPAYLVQLAGPLSTIQAEHMAGTDHRSTDFLVGTGPFNFESYTPAVQFTMVRNPNYFKRDALGNQLPYLEGISIFLGESTQFVTDAFIAGRLDLIHPYGAQVYLGAELDRLRDSAPADTIFLPFAASKGTAPFMLQFNMKTVEAFQDVRVRRAFALLFNSEQLNEVYTGSSETVDSGHYVFGPFYQYNAPQEEIAEILGWNQSWEDRVAQAKQLMKDAGHEDGFKVRVIFVPAAGYGFSAVLPVYTTALKEINVEVVLQGEQVSVMIKRLYAKDWDLYCQAFHALTGDPSEFAGSFQCGSRANHSTYCNPEADALWEQLAQELDSLKRREISQDLERLLAKDVAALPGIFITGYSVFRANVKNFRQTGASGPHMKFEDVWLEP